jgi:hypothetical protein
METPNCEVCGARSHPFKVITGLAYFACDSCGSLFADFPAYERERSTRQLSYDTRYWEMELRSARQRAYGSTLQRVAETFLYCRRPIRRFIDIGAGPGILLDALRLMMPSSAGLFHAVELFPPEERFRTQHPGYLVGSLDDTHGQFDAGVCIEVIEHLDPNALRGLVASLAKKAAPGSTFYFNSGQPEYVMKEDPGYLDPFGRGHIASYSLAGLTKLFEPHGFRIVPLPGRSWCFLAEFEPAAAAGGNDVDGLLKRLWTAMPENVSALKDPQFGPLMYSMGIESARCYLEAARGARLARTARGTEIPA